MGKRYQNWTVNATLYWILEQECVMVEEAAVMPLNTQPLLPIRSQCGQLPLVVSFYVAITSDKKKEATSCFIYNHWKHISWERTRHVQCLKQLQFCGLCSFYVICTANLPSMISGPIFGNKAPQGAQQFFLLPFLLKTVFFSIRHLGKFLSFKFLFSMIFKKFYFSKA